MSQIDHPSHYRSDSGIEAIDVIEAWDLGFNLGNVIKYVSRAGLKDDAVKDLKKARWYLDREIANLQAEDDPEEDFVKPAPMRSMRFAVVGSRSRLEVSATESGAVRMSFMDSDAYIAPDAARSMADSIGKREGFGGGAVSMGFTDSGMECAVHGNGCILTKAQEPILASVLREMADEAEGEAHE